VHLLLATIFLALGMCNAGLAPFSWLSACVMQAILLDRSDEMDPSHFHFSTSNRRPRLPRKQERLLLQTGSARHQSSSLPLWPSSKFHTKKIHGVLC